MDSDTSQISYSKIRPHYEAFTSKLEGLIKDLLNLNSIKFHVIEARTKSVESFSEKIRRHGKDYKNPLKDLPDLCGVRIIVYYQDDVPVVENLLAKELQIFEKELSHSVAGYLSVHYVVGLDKNRCVLSEWANYAKFKAEIQIRTVLQHSWAAISHALQYKREDDVPHTLQRKLFRLASLFELADEEFLTIRDTKIATQENARIAIKEGSLEIPIDPSTLEAFLENWKEFKPICKYISSIGYVVEENIPSDDSNEILGEITSWCKKLNIPTIAKLEEILPKKYKSYFKDIDEFEDGWRVNNAFILNLLLILAFPNDFTVEELVENGWSSGIATRVIKGAKAAQ